MEGRTEAERRWVETTGFTAEAGTICLLPGASGGVERVLFGWDEGDPWCWAHLPVKLPKGVYRIEPPLTPASADWAALAWALAGYQFSRYLDRKPPECPRLVWPQNAHRAEVASTVEAVRLVRDLVNTPSSDMGPEELNQAAALLAERTGASLSSIIGDELLERNYPLIHAVGRASSRPPRLLDLRWGEALAPKVTLVGKGVCFDSGGLDLKTASGMKLMKKDMGGAAHVLGLAAMIIAAKIPVRLRVLVPAVENAVSGSAFRPSDILTSRKGLSVEIGNTDAEGRLVLADALAEADSEKPDLLIDLATLTGAARTALGPDLPAMFTPDDDLAAAILAAAEAEHDPVWRLPLWKSYRRLLDSKVADINNAPDSPYAGAVTAALFLQEFVSPGTSWVHFDIFAWNPSARPGRPEGGEAMAIRALYRLIAQRYPS
ncbi:leucyl aminopeptidase [Telmatospirillum siberiense]|uniref:Leucyl aminopeptidase n=2 Tax=Telmatospirillum siberiense TaxID=382514 RepID=A0A2N3Q0T6_9PROT|nr:leucyl aminopeptidase [Telmatospirillum siberiense]